MSENASSWLVYIGILVAINVVSHVFDLGFIVY